MPEVLTSTFILMSGKTKQTQRDLEKCEQRMRDCQVTYKAMEQKLKNYPKEALLAEAQKFTKLAMENNRQIPAPDRIAIRQRRALLCWFCMHHPEVLSDHFSLDLSPYLSARYYLNSESQTSPTTFALLQMETVDESPSYSKPSADFWDTFEWGNEIWTE
jgi:hypothetical protein